MILQGYKHSAIFFADKWRMLRLRYLGLLNPCCSNKVPVRGFISANDRFIVIVLSLRRPVSGWVNIPRSQLPIFNEVVEKIGDPDRIRTCDPQIRNLVLYPTELRDLTSLCRLHRLYHRPTIDQCWGDIKIIWLEIEYLTVLNNRPIRFLCPGSCYLGSH